MSKLKAQGNASGTGVFTLQTPPTNTDRTISLPDSTGTLVDTTGATFTGAVTGTDVTLSGGLYVGGTGSANYLDDYEEGTWTPTFGSGGWNSYPSLSSSYDSNKGHYVKIGKTIHCHFTIRIDSATNPAVGHHFLLAGLPFSADGNINGVTTDYSQSLGSACLRDALSSNQMAYFQVGTNSGGGTSILLSCHYSTANSGYTQRALQGSFTYRTA